MPTTDWQPTDELCERYAVGADGAHLVGHRAVGVQVGIPRAGVAVVEGRHDQSRGVDLGDTVGAHAGKRGMLLEEFDGFGDRLVMTVLDDFRNRQRGYGPQCGDGLDRRKCQIEAGDGFRRSGLAGNESGEFAGICRLTLILLNEHFPADRGADLGLDLGIKGIVKLSNQTRI